MSRNFSGCLPRRTKIASLDQLAALGINENSVREKLLSSHQGCLCEEEGSVVGFAIGDRSSGEMLVIAVRPTHIRRGIGSGDLTYHFVIAMRSTKEAESRRVASRRGFHCRRGEASFLALVTVKDRVGFREM
jgi:hypothetical protein